MPYCFDVKFRTARPIGADKLKEVFKPRAFKRPLRLYRPDGMNRHEGWLAVESCGYADFAEARAGGARLQEALLITAAKRKVGVEFYVCGAVEAIHVYPGGQFELRDPGLPLPTILSDQELKEMVVAAVESATSLKTNQRVTAELLNDSFFKMSPEASFLVRVSTVEALCPQADQTENFRGNRGQCAGFDTGRRIGSGSGSDQAGPESASQEAVRAQRVQVKDQAAFRRR